MATFICDFTGCVNKGVEYNFDDDSIERVVCGGCKDTLLALPSDE
jgi:hypothetical protein